MTALKNDKLYFSNDKPKTCSYCDYGRELQFGEPWEFIIFCMNSKSDHHRHLLLDSHPDCGKWEEKRL